MTLPNITYASYFSQIAARYDAFILDLWGVIHDGRNAYPGAIECLLALRAAGKKIVLLSNAPRRAAVAAETLERMGVDGEKYDALITSGETAYRFLEAGDSDVFRPEGRNYIYLGLERDRDVLGGLKFAEVNDPHAASFLLLSHSSYDNQPLSELEPLLARCREAGLATLCINPDTEVVRQNGEHVMCAGVIAADYSAKGGKVVYFGKPYAMVYEASFKVLATDKTRILAVGDNLATDIAGARAQGIASAFITGGVFRKSLGEASGEAYRARCEELFKYTGFAPDFVLPAFKWQ